MQIGSGTEVELCDFAQVSTLSEPPIPEGDPGRPWMQREGNATRGKAPETSTETVIQLSKIFDTKVTDGSEWERTNFSPSIKLRKPDT